MPDNYKIYYDDSFVLISDDRAQMNKNFGKVISGDSDIGAFLHKPVFYTEEANKENTILIFTEKPGWVMEMLKKNADVVLAGGGIVFNESDELLMIHRKGKWDLPKGEMDKGEKIIRTAAREVEEETGVKIETTIDEPYITYHAYILKGKNCLKETYWYEMKAKPEQNNLVPQADEGIDKVLWVKKSDLKNYEAEAHPLVRDIIRVYYPK